MMIQFEKLKARLLANPEVKAEYEARAGVRDCRRVAQGTSCTQASTEA